MSNNISPAPPPVTTVELPPGYADQLSYTWDQQNGDPIDLPSRIILIVDGAHHAILNQALAVPAPDPVYKYRRIANIDIGLQVTTETYHEPPELPYAWTRCTISVAPVATVLWSENPWINISILKRPPLPPGA
jgi:hypothetical protein